MTCDKNQYHLYHPAYAGSCQKTCTNNMVHRCAMTSWNGNIFRVTGHLCGEFTGPLLKGQWRGALMFSMIGVGINGWVNNRKAGDLRRHRAHYDVIVMECVQSTWQSLMGNIDSSWTSMVDQAGFLSFSHMECVYALSLLKLYYRLQGLCWLIVSLALAPVRCGSNFRSVISEHMLQREEY